MSPQLSVRNAQIATAAVEIKTLTVSGKQVTLAVFRQLIEEQLIDEDKGTLCGVPWGTVNYHPDKCGDAATHLHVVWQKGDELRRSRVDAPEWWRKYFFSEGSDDLIQADYCLHDHKSQPAWRTYRDPDGDTGIRFQLDDMQCETVGEPRWCDHKCRTQDDYDQDLKWVLEDIAQEKQRRGRVAGHWKALKDLPQLFIAV